MILTLATSVKVGAILAGIASWFGIVASSVGVYNLKKTKEIHVLVNSRLDEVLNRNIQLAGVIEKTPGLVLPDDPKDTKPPPADKV
jgi:hypothetical protein